MSISFDTHITGSAKAFFAIQLQVLSDGGLLGLGLRVREGGGEGVNR